MRHLKRIEDLIIERLGVPNQTEFYVGLFINEVKDKIIGILKNQSDAITQTISAGKKAQKEGRPIKKIPIPEEAFNGVLKTEVTPEHKFSGVNYEIKVSFVPEGGWGDKNIACEGSYSPNFHKPGDPYTIDMDLHIQYNIQAHMGGMNNILEDIVTDIKGTMYHELNHAYEDYMRKSHGDIGLAVKSRINNSISSLKEYFEVPAAQQFFYLLYLSISTEMNARIPSLIPQLKVAKDQAEKISIIENSTEWKFNNMLLTFNAEEWLNSMGQDFSMGGMLPKSFAIRGIKETINGMMDLITKISKDGGEGLLNAIKENYKDQDIAPLEDITKQLDKQVKLSLHLLHKQPIEYFEYWQRVFNERGEYARRKMLRLASY